MLSKRIPLVPQQVGRAGRARVKVRRRKGQDNHLVGTPQLVELLRKLAAKRRHPRVPRLCLRVSPAARVPHGDRRGAVLEKAGRNIVKHQQLDVRRRVAQQALGVE